MKRSIVPLFLALCLLLEAPVYAAGKDAVRVAVIDTGVSQRAISAEQCIEGYNYILASTETADSVGHGTAVAAIIAGCRSAGVDGLCPEAVIVPFVFYMQGSDGTVAKGNTNMLANMILDAVNIYHCDIINISSGATTQSDALREAVHYARTKGVLVVSCAGNDGTDALYYPGANSDVLCVGALNQKGTAPAAFSNRNNTVDLLAPGTLLPTADSKGNQMLISGTSFATAYTSGAAAALITEFPDITGWEAGQILQATAVDMGKTGRDDDSGWGALNMDAAREYAAVGRVFHDVTPQDWCFDAISKAIKAGYIAPAAGGRFSPGAAATRSVLWEGFCRVDGETTSDVRSWAMENGVSDGTNGDRAVTRAQLAAMFYRYAGLTGCDTTQRSDLSRYKDAGQIPDYARDAMSWAVATGLINGTSTTTISPNGTATRAQFATILIRFCERIER